MELNYESSHDAFSIFQGIFLLVGLLANLIFLATLLKHELKSFLTSVLLRLQFLTDAIVCLIGSIIIFEPDYQWSHSTSGMLYCHLWHSQYLYWIMTFSSILNLICITVDRYWAIITPLSYKANQRSRALLCGVFVTVSCNIGVFPTSLLVKYVNGTCLNEAAVNNSALINFLKAPYAILWWIMIYLIPSLCHVILNIRIIHALKLIYNNATVNDGVEHKSFTTQYTRSTILVTATFIVTMSFGSTFYMLSNIIPHLVTYQLNGAMQRTGLFLASVNSCSNPFIYFIFMHTFRNLILQKFPCCKNRIGNLESLEEPSKLQPTNTTNKTAQNSSM